MSVPSKDLEEVRPDAEQLPNQLLRASSKDEALEVAIKAAETSMQALKLAQDPSEKARLSTRVSHLLTEAEKIKQSKDWRKAVQSPQLIDLSTKGAATANSKPRTLKEAQSTRQLHTQEKVLLLRAGYLNGFKFPPWTTPPEPNEFELREGEELFLYVSLIFSSLYVQLTVSTHQRHARTPAFRVSRRSPRCLEAPGRCSSATILVPRRPY